MTRRLTTRSPRFWGGLAAVAVLAIAAGPARAEGRAQRIGPELARGGLTIAEETARQQRLHRELSDGLPAGVSLAPLKVEIDQADREDLAYRAPSGTAPLRVGVVKSVPGQIGKPHGSAFNHGVISQNKDGSFVWAMRVSSEGAQAIRLFFTDFSLPGNTEMFFIADNGQALGPFVETGRDGTGEFWTHSIASDSGTIVMRYTGTTPKADLRKTSFVVSSLGHIRGRLPSAHEKSHDSWPCRDNAPCVVDVNCVNTGPAAPAENAVAKMEWISGQFINTCTGGLLADTDPGSQIPYFLTANHCLSTSNSSLETFFNYTTDSCNGACPDGLVSGGTPPPANTIGATVMATGTSADFTLLRLNQAPPAGATFLGWNNNAIANTAGAALHRVSNPNFGPQAYSQHTVDPTSPTCTGWNRGPRIYSVDQVGATMGGSSGSPVVNSAGEVVGQLSGCCGFNCGDECDAENNWTVDGALANYWSQVAGFLDPQPSCTTNAECDDGLFCSGTETCNSGNCSSSGNPCGAGETCNESTNSCDLPACDNDGACEGGEDCNNCPNDCRSKVSGAPSSRYCCDGDLPDCGNAACSESGWVCGGGGGGCSVNGDCTDGQFCNGAETCSGGSCQSGTDPCPGQSCNESTDTCVSCGGNKAPCNSNADCCSNNCKGGSCKGG